MKHLLDIGDRFPLPVTVVGTLSGLLSWVLAHTDQITGIAGLVGAVCTASIALLALTSRLFTLAEKLAGCLRAAERNQRARTDFFRATRLRLEDNGDETFTLLEPATWFDHGTGLEIVAPAGFTTDFASVPRMLWNIIPPYGAHGFAAVIHDSLYARRGRIADRVLSRGECDRIFREAMAARGVRWSRRWVMWLGVRLGGWMPWHFGEAPKLGIPAVDDFDGGGR